MVDLQRKIRNDIGKITQLILFIDLKHLLDDHCAVLIPGIVYESLLYLCDRSDCSAVKQEQQHTHCQKQSCGYQNKCVAEIRVNTVLECVPFICYAEHSFCFA